MLKFNSLFLVQMESLRQYEKTPRFPRLIFLVARSRMLQESSVELC